MSTINVSLEPPPPPPPPQRSDPAPQLEPASCASRHLQDTSGTTRRIVRACVRCRKQKAKCDPFRPCSVCVKADVECISRPLTDGRQDASCDRPDIRPAGASLPEERPAKVRRVSSAHPAGDVSAIKNCNLAASGQRSSLAGRRTGSPQHDDDHGRDHGHDYDHDIAGDNVPIIDVRESSMNTRLFTLTPGHLMENLPTSQPLADSDSPAIISPRAHLTGTRDSISSPSASTIIGPRDRAVLPWSYSRASAASLLAHLPPRPVTDYLIAVYFNTVHWFMVVLHEGHFLHNYRTMMDLYARNPSLLSNTDEDFTFALLVLTIVVLGGRYTSTHATRLRRCKDIYNEFYRTVHAPTPESVNHLDVDLVKTTSQIFSIVRNNSTDVLACGTIATVQMLLLLGSLYLYHGESNLAWTNSGCTIRAAQALGLHKELSELRWSSAYYQRMDSSERCQLRRRLFWAVHTSDRFLAMCYGLPLLISDDECLSGAPCESTIYPSPGCSSFLMIEDDLQQPIPSNPPHGNRPPATLLTYQTYKLHIYIILGDIISALYRQSSGGQNPLLSKYKGDEQTSAAKRTDTEPESLIDTVQRLERQLENWYNDLPPRLHLSSDMTYPPYDDLAGGESNPDDDDIIIPAYDDLHKESVTTQRRRLRIRNGIYGMQALLFQLAYDNALILIHRPILASKNSSPSTLPPRIFSRSVDACWKAALRISNIGKHHIFSQNHQAHAVSYVCVHLFTAGVVLSVFASSAPLSRRSWEAKQGLSRIIRMQRRLRRKVIVSSQSLLILENLAREVMRKETATMLAQDMDNTEDEAGEAIEFGPTREQWSHENTLSGASRDVSTLPNSQQDLDLPPDSAASQSEVSAGLLMGFSNEMVLEDYMINESALDIEKFLSDPQFLAAADPNITNDAFTNTSQATGMWWFPPCDRIVDSFLSAHGS